MRTNLTRALQTRRPLAAVAAFTCYESITASAVVAHAERRDEPVILLVAPSTIGADYGLDLIAALRALADRAAVPVSVQLDHATDLDVIRAAFAAGGDSVLADGSALPVEANVELVQEAAEIARGHDGAVEAELGRVDGDEDLADLQEAPGRLTEPAEVAGFVTAGGADVLAVSVGNRHGNAPRGGLDWPRLAAIAGQSPVPLALHGASRLAPPDRRRAIRAGVAKVNINTELRRAYFGAVDAGLAIHRPGFNLHALLADTRTAVGQAVSEVLDSLTTPTTDCVAR
jgi:tagatose 1,6-diphosphate aldolase GatY/KbaY